MNFIFTPNNRSLISRRLIGYVKKELPSDIKSYPHSIGPTVDKIITMNPYSKRKVYCMKIFLRKTLKRELLALKMCEAAIEAFGQSVPPALSNAVDLLSDTLQVPPVITYEEIIMENRGFNRLTFTEGALRESEMFFYDGNWKVEVSLMKILAQILPLLENTAPIPSMHFTPTSNTERIQFAIHTVVEEKTNIGLTMKELFSLHKEHFDYFRRFLVGSQWRHLKGPSGAFTAKVPILEMSVFGKKCDAEYVSYVVNNLKYFPRCDHKELMWGVVIAQGNKKSLVEAIESEKLMYELKELLLSFRGKHLGLVKKKLPDESKGTAGENFLPFLKDRIEQTKNL